MIDDTRTLITETGRIGLDGREILLGHSLEEIDRTYNGIGAEWMPEKTRRAITKFYSVFAPAALIHDCDYAWQPDRSREVWHYVNYQFYLNCRKCVKDAYPWYAPRRYRLFLMARAMFLAVETSGGWKAWENAVNCK